MRHYSAAEAISPAIERTKQFLFRPFRWGRFLKLTLVAALVEGGMSSCNFNNHFPTGNTGGSGKPFQWPGGYTPHIPPLPAIEAIVGISVVVMLIVIPIGILISYLLIRLRFSYFDCVLRGRDWIGEAWDRYHRQAMRYLGLSLLIGLGFWVVLGALGYEGYLHFLPVLQRLGTDNPPGFEDFLPMIAMVAPILMVFAILVAFIHITMSNFVLPRMALGDASIGEALADVWDDLRVEPGQFALFFLLRFLVSLAGSILAMIALAVPLVIVAIVGVIIGLILKAISTTLVLFLGIPAGILLVFLIILAMIGLTGTIGTYRRNYGILFYAGRYPAMAAVLWPAPPQPPPPPPIASFYPESPEPLQN
jgi:hypothetical protein